MPVTVCLSDVFIYLFQQQQSVLCWAQNPLSFQTRFLLPPLTTGASKSMSTEAFETVTWCITGIQNSDNFRKWCPSRVLDLQIVHHNDALHAFLLEAATTFLSQSLVTQLAILFEWIKLYIYLPHLLISTRRPALMPDTRLKFVLRFRIQSILLTESLTGDWTSQWLTVIQCCEGEHTLDSAFLKCSEK